VADPKFDLSGDVDFVNGEGGVKIIETFDAEGISKDFA